tara:strand:- start:290 stop:502 length:213 start_codon:yes stop_codon:yes gene_type:complete
MNTFTGSEPTIGRFHVDSTNAEWCIHMMMADGQRRERYIPITENLAPVYAILRENGFTMAGFQSAEIINL